MTTEIIKNKGWLYFFKEKWGIKTIKILGKNKGYLQGWPKRGGGGCHCPCAARHPKLDRTLEIPALGQMGQFCCFLLPFLAHSGQSARYPVLSVQRHMGSDSHFHLILGHPWFPGMQVWETGRRREKEVGDARRESVHFVRWCPAFYSPRVKNPIKSLIIHNIVLHLECRSSCRQAHDHLE